ncbi:MAG: PilZ domain-containing protein [Firmicutes bacterium]|nr:PilZ domain-containing protein [Bacillota bacterium]
MAEPSGEEQPQDASGGASSREREFERVGDTLLVSYSIAEEFEPEFTEAYDIAAGGMAMITNAELPKGVPVIVQIELRGDSRPVIRVAGIVRWSHFDTMLRRYRTGVSFIDVDDQTHGDLLRYIDTLHLLRDMGVL